MINEGENEDVNVESGANLGNVVSELLPQWSGLHSEEAASISGWFASAEHQRAQAELQA